jgi:hypothetical protein
MAIKICSRQVFYNIVLLDKWFCYVIITVCSVVSMARVGLILPLIPMESIFSSKCHVVDNIINALVHGMHFIIKSKWKCLNLTLNSFINVINEVNMRYYLVIFSSATIFLALTERLKQSAPNVSIATTGTSCQPKQK